MGRRRTAACLREGPVRDTRADLGGSGDGLRVLADEAQRLVSGDIIKRSERAREGESEALPRALRRQAPRRR